MALPTVTGEFRVVEDPELRFSPNGVAVGTVRLVASSRKKNEQTDEWEDDKILWVTGTAFKQFAENICESFRKGDLVIVTGRLQTEEWEDREGGKRSRTSMLINEIGHSVKWDPARTMRAERQRGGEQQSGERRSEQSSSQGEDPWASAPRSDEPPF